MSVQEVRLRQSVTKDGYLPFETNKQKNKKIGNKLIDLYGVEQLVHTNSVLIHIKNAIKKGVRIVNLNKKVDSYKATLDMECINKIILIFIEIYKLPSIFNSRIILKSGNQVQAVEGPDGTRVFIHKKRPITSILNYISSRRVEVIGDDLKCNKILDIIVRKMSSDQSSIGEIGVIEMFNYLRHSKYEVSGILADIRSDLLEQLAAIDVKERQGRVVVGDAQAFQPPVARAGIAEEPRPFQPPVARESVVRKSRSFQPPVARDSRLSQQPLVREAFVFQPSIATPSLAGESDRVIPEEDEDAYTLSRNVVFEAVNAMEELLFNNERSEAAGDLNDTDELDNVDMGVPPPLAPILRSPTREPILRSPTLEKDEPQEDPTKRPVNRTFVENLRQARRLKTSLVDPAKLLKKDSLLEFVHTILSKDTPLKIGSINGVILASIIEFREKGQVQNLLNDLKSGEKNTSKFSEHITDNIDELYYRPMLDDDELRIYLNLMTPLVDGTITLEEVKNTGDQAAAAAAAGEDISPPKESEQKVKKVKKEKKEKKEKKGKGILDFENRGFTNSVSDRGVIVDATDKTLIGRTTSDFIKEFNPDISVPSAPAPLLVRIANVPNVPLEKATQRKNDVIDDILNELDRMTQNGLIVRVSNDDLVNIIVGIIKKRNIENKVLNATDIANIVNKYKNKYPDNISTLEPNATKPDVPKNFNLELSISNMIKWLSQYKGLKLFDSEGVAINNISVAEQVVDILGLKKPQRKPIDYPKYKYILSVKLADVQVEAQGVSVSLNGRFGIQTIPEPNEQVYLNTITGVQNELIQKQPVSNTPSEPRKTEKITEEVMNNYKNEAFKIGKWSANTNIPFEQSLFFYDDNGVLIPNKRQIPDDRLNEVKARYTDGVNEFRQRADQGAGKVDEDSLKAQTLSIGLKQAHDKIRYPTPILNQAEYRFETFRDGFARLGAQLGLNALFSKSYKVYSNNAGNYASGVTFPVRWEYARAVRSANDRAIKTRFLPMFTSNVPRLKTDVNPFDFDISLRPDLIDNLTQQEIDKIQTDVDKIRNESGMKYLNSGDPSFDEFLHIAYSWGIHRAFDGLGFITPTDIQLLGRRSNNFSNFNESQKRGIEGIAREGYEQFIKRSANLPARTQETKTSGFGTKKGAGNKKGRISNVKIYKNPQDMIERLNTLIGIKDAGNNSHMIKNEISSILDALLMLKKISKKEHKIMFNEFTI